MLGWGFSLAISRTERAELRRNMTHVLIATPTAGGVVKALYATTLVKTIVAVKEAGWGVDFLTVDSSYISKARNYFAHFLLRQPHFTHLVMIDSDMAVEGP